MMQYYECDRCGFTNDSKTGCNMCKSCQQTIFACAMLSYFLTIGGITFLIWLFSLK